MNNTNTTTVEVYKDVKMTIEEINRNGNVTFKFNQDLIVPPQFDDKRRLETIDIKTIMEITFDSDSEQISFSISIQEWTTKHLIINLNFTDPLEVSSGENLDTMLVQVLIGDLFVSEKSLQTIYGSNRQMSEFFPKQLPYGTSVESIELHA